MAHRRYTLEASLQLYSSEPSVMTPAELYGAARDPVIRDQLVGANLYLITCRPRILIDPQRVDLVGLERDMQDLAAALVAQRTKHQVSI